ncbi:unnamed protein product [Rotaria magnacalcarata]
MGDEGSIQNLEVDWNEFLIKFHAQNEQAKQNLRKVDLFPGKDLVCFVLHNVFAPEECQFLIDSIENIVSISKPTFCFTYEPGQFFAPHFDGIFKKSYMEQSQLTIMAYLNDSYTGGHTNFLDDNTKPHDITYALKPETGMVLIFQHDLFHEGETVSTGKKYIMRSDVMYKRTLIEPMSTKEHEARELLAQAEQFEDQSNYDEASKCYRKAYKLWPELEKEFGK